MATNFEEKIRNLQEAPHLTGNDFLPLTVMLDEMVNTFNRIKQLADRLGLTTNGKKTNSGSVGNMQSNQGGSSSVMQKYFENFASDDISDEEYCNISVFEILKSFLCIIL